MGGPEPVDGIPRGGIEQPQTETPQDVIAEHRKRLAALAARGMAKENIGQSFTSTQIESLSDSEIEDLYLQHETRLGSLMTGSVGRTMLELYALGASKVMPIVASHTHRRRVYVDQPALVEFLEHDPIATRIVNNLSCELYHSYGWSLGPATFLTATIKHTHFIDEDPRDVNYGGTQPTGREYGGEATSVATSDAGGFCPQT